MANKNRKKAKIFLLIWGILMVATIIYVAVQSLVFGFSKPLLESSAKTDALFSQALAEVVAVSSSNNDSQLSDDTEKSNPVKIKIPTIGVDANVQQIGLKASGIMGTPTNYYDVGWFKLGPVPGEKGNAIITGHLDTKDSPSGVFYNLNKLKIGDLINVENSGGETISFKITGSKIYRYDENPQEVFGQTEKKRLSLITCTGNWLESQKTYDERLVVFAERIN